MKNNFFLVCHLQQGQLLLGPESHVGAARVPCCVQRGLLEPTILQGLSCLCRLAPPERWHVSDGCLLPALQSPHFSPTWEELGASSEWKSHLEEFVPSLCLPGRAETAREPTNPGI